MTAYPFLFAVRISSTMFTHCFFFFTGWPPPVGYQDPRRRLLPSMTGSRQQQPRLIIPAECARELVTTTAHKKSCLTTFPRLWNFYSFILSLLKEISCRSLSVFFLPYKKNLFSFLKVYCVFFFLFILKVGIL